MKPEAGSQPHGTPIARCLTAINGLTRPCTIAIDGRSAAGKSTLAGRVSAALDEPVTLIHGDDFYRVMDDDIRFELPPAAGYDQDFDWQRLQRDVLEPLRRGSPAEYRPYDWSHNALGQSNRIDPAPVVIAEGVYMSRPELRHLFDLVIWVSTGPRERLERQRRRDDSMAWIDRWHRAEDHYVETHRPHESADLLVIGQ